MAGSSTIEVAGREVGRLGFGAMRIMGADDPAALVRRVVELGVQFIDTADIYGDGASETIIADAISPYPDDVLIATKGGFVPGEIQPGQRSLPPDGRPERLKRVCEESLQRLRVDRIDLYQLHMPDPDVPIEDSVGALVELREAGKIDRIGLSNVGRGHIAKALDVTPIASVQNRYNVKDQTSNKVLDFCAERGIAFLPWGPIQTGADEALDEVAAEVGATPSQVALAWLLARSPVMLPIPGTSKVAHLEENVGATAVVLDDELRARLDAQPAA
jgi:aryl-alcohol dehydrogenase-like predicted oxidoreductase